jgi:hypothetical protein
MGIDNNLAPEEPLSKEEAMRRLREWIPWLTRVVRYLSTPRRYTLEMEGGAQVDLGAIDTLLSQRKFRGRVAEATGRLLRWVDQRYWDGMAQAILDAAEDVETPEAEELDALRGWLEVYLAERAPIEQGGDEVNWLEGVRREEPIYKDGEILINTTNFSMWVADRRGQRMLPRDLAILLRRYGAEPERVRTQYGNTSLHRRYWRIPASLLPGSLLSKNVPSSPCVPVVPDEPSDLAREFESSSTQENDFGATCQQENEQAPFDVFSSGHVARSDDSIVQDDINPRARWLKSSGTSGTGSDLGTILEEEGEDEWVL